MRRRIDFKLAVMISLILALFFNFFIHERIYPFSDFYMFSFLRLEPTFCTLAFKDKEGNIEFIKVRDVYPMSRLGLHQMCYSNMKSKNFEWISIFVNRIKDRSNYSQVLVVKARFDIAQLETQIVEEFYVQALQ
jgi:hypothetical protein